MDSSIFFKWRNVVSPALRYRAVSRPHAPCAGPMPCSSCPGPCSALRPLVIPSGHVPYTCVLKSCSALRYCFLPCSKIYACCPAIRRGVHQMCMDNISHVKLYFDSINRDEKHVKRRIYHIRIMCIFICILYAYVSAFVSWTALGVFDLPLRTTRCVQLGASRKVKHAQSRSGKRMTNSNGNAIKSPVRPLNAEKERATTGRCSRLARSDHSPLPIPRFMLPLHCSTVHNDTCICTLSHLHYYIPTISLAMCPFRSKACAPCHLWDAVKNP